MRPGGKMSIEKRIESTDTEKELEMGRIEVFISLDKSKAFFCDGDRVLATVSADSDADGSFLSFSEKR